MRFAYIGINITINGIIIFRIIYAFCYHRKYKELFLNQKKIGGGGEQPYFTILKIFKKHKSPTYDFL
jgi:hypothetical protein